MPLLTSMLPLNSDFQLHDLMHQLALRYPGVGLPPSPFNPFGQSSQDLLQQVPHVVQATSEASPGQVGRGRQMPVTQLPSAFGQGIGIPLAMPFARRPGQ